MAKHKTGPLTIYICTTDTTYDTGLMGMWDGQRFVVPFQDDLTAEECARIVSHALQCEIDAVEGD